MYDKGCKQEEWNLCGDAFMGCSHLEVAEGSGNGGLSSLSGLYMGRIPRRDSVKPTEGKDFCS